MDKKRTLLSITIISIIFNVGFLVIFIPDIKTLINHKDKPDIIGNNGCVQDKYSCYLYCDTVNDINVLPSDGINTHFLPDRLVVSPGIYKIGSSVIDMRKEGLYRIVFPNENNYQVIVYKNNLKAVLSSLAWIHTHGNADNKCSAAELSTKAIHDKLYLTCSKIASFSCKLLNNLGYTTRIVGGIASDNRNGFDDEHTLLEILEPVSNKWMVVDIDNNSIFKRKDDNTLLNFHEFREALYADEAEQMLLSSDVKFDISGFKSKNDNTMGFIMERRNNSVQLLKWYKRIFRTMIIEQDFYSKLDIERIRKEHPDYKYCDSVSFVRKHYPLSGYTPEHSIP